MKARLLKERSAYGHARYVCELEAEDGAEERKIVKAMAMAFPETYIDGEQVGMYVRLRAELTEDEAQSPSREAPWHSLVHVEHEKADNNLRKSLAEKRWAKPWLSSAGAKDRIASVEIAKKPESRPNIAKLFRHCLECRCGFVGKSEEALAAHQRKCQTLRDCAKLFARCAAWRERLRIESEAAKNRQDKPVPKRVRGRAVGIDGAGKKASKPAR